MPPRRGHDDKTAQRTHIPRPPNAFILFRSSFIRSNHVPGQVEGNHSTLSKIIGLCWKALPQQERRSWEEKARLAQAEHRTLYPDWRWTPEANALGKKRARKRKKTDTDDDDNSSESQPKRKGRAKVKGKARERDPDSSEHDEDARVAKIADLVKEGKTGAVLEKALGEWQASIASTDPRPTKKRRISRKQQDFDNKNNNSDSNIIIQQPQSSNSPSTSSLPAPVSPQHPSSRHVFRRSPSAPTDPPDLSPSNTLLTHEPSHTPSPTAFYPDSRPVQPSTITWSENTTPASYPASQPNFSQWWNSPSDPPSTSPFGTCYDSPEISTDGLGYEEGSRFDREYGQQFGQLARPHDNSDGTHWSRNPGRNGICTVVNDPLPECDHSPTTSSPASFPPPVDVVPPAIISPSPSTQFFSSNGNISPSSNNPGFIPSTYSSLTGWAGEFGDPADSASSSGWFTAGWQGPQRLSSSWGQQCDISDSVTRSDHQSSHHNHKIPYLDQQSSLRPSLSTTSSSSPATAILHQLGSSTPTQPANS